MNYNAFLDRMTFNQKAKHLFFDIHKKADRFVSQAQAAYDIDDDAFGAYIEKMSAEIDIPAEQLTFYLYIRFSERTLESYKNRGIDDDVFYATMSDFARNCERTEELYGIYGIQQQVYRKWFRFNLDLLLFRLGRLQFDIRKSRVASPELGLNIDDIVLNVHIPKGRSLLEEECEQSYDYARNFFEKHFGAKDCFFICASWLLHPWMRDVLPEDASIIKFQKKFKLIEIITNYAVVRNWIFPGCDGINLDQLPQDTSLQRAAVIKMKNNEEIGEAIGIRK